MYAVMLSDTDLCLDTGSTASGTARHVASRGTRVSSVQVRRVRLGTRQRIYVTNCVQAPRPAQSHIFGRALQGGATSARDTPCMTFVHAGVR